MRTRIVLGSSLQPTYIHSEVYHLLKQFIVFPPVDVTTRANLLEFEVSHAHVYRHANPSHRYSIQTDESLQVQYLESYHYEYNPLHLRLSEAPKSDRFDRISIFRECLDGPFLLKKDAIYTHVQVIEEETSVQLEGWGYLWTTLLQKRWVCPYDSSLDASKLVFRCKPVYMAFILVEGHPPVDVIKKFIQFGFPSYFYGSYLPIVHL